MLLKLVCVAALAVASGEVAPRPALRLRGGFKPTSAVVPRGALLVLNRGAPLFRVERRPCGLCPVIELCALVGASSVSPRAPPSRRPPNSLRFNRCVSRLARLPSGPHTRPMNILFMLGRGGA